MCHLSTAFSAAAPPSEGRRLTLRSGPARQAYSDYSHYSPRHAGGMAGGRLRCITPSSCSPASLPGRSATGDTLCTSPSQRRPLRQPPPVPYAETREEWQGPGAGGRARPPRPSVPCRPIRTLTSPPSLSDIHTVAVGSPALTIGGRVSRGREAGGRRLAGGWRRHDPAHNERRSCQTINLRR